MISPITWVLVFVAVIIIIVVITQMNRTDPAYPAGSATGTGSGADTSATQDIAEGTASGDGETSGESEETSAQSDAPVTSDPPAIGPVYAEDLVPLTERERTAQAAALAANPGFDAFGAPWRGICTAIYHPDAGDIATITYAFADESYGPNYYPFREHVGLDAMTTAEMRFEVEEGLRDLARLFAAAYPGRALRFVQTDARTAQIVFAVISMPNEPGTLAYAFGNAYGEGDGQGLDSDVMFNKAVNWRPDASGAGYSLRYTTAHELMHALGFGHHADAESLMYPVAGQAHSVASRFPQGLASSGKDRAAWYGVYTLERCRSTMRA